MNRLQRIVLSCLPALGLLALAACDSTTTNPGLGTSPSYDDVQDPPVTAQTAPLTIAPCGLYIAATTEQAISRAHAAPKSPDMEEFPLPGGLSCIALVAAVPAVEESWGGHAVVYQLPALAQLAEPPALAVHASMEWADPIAAAPPAPPAVAIPDPSQDPGGVVASLLAAAKAGQWRLLAGLVLSVLVWAARRWGSGAVPWLKTDRGGAVLVLLLALLGGIGTSLAGSGPFGLSLLVNSLSMAFVSAGGYTVVKRILSPSDAK
jgi:hypothetical protein